MKRRADLSNSLNMTTLNKRLCCALLGAGVVLSACGGGGSGDDGGANTAKNSDKPAAGSIGSRPASSSGASGASRLPALPAGGQASVTGELVFGIGTQKNNAMPSQPNILALDQYGYFSTTYKGDTFSSAIDSGSNANVFADYTIPFSGDWYVPATTLSLSAILTGVDKAAPSVNVPFSLANGWNLLANQYAAYDSLGSPSAGMFIWGLPFFFGRSVYTAINNVMIGKQAGPFIAF
jgi:hypothetical protein